jgi:hypothetical protein
MSGLRQRLKNMGLLIQSFPDNELQFRLALLLQLHNIHK